MTASPAAPSAPPPVEPVGAVGGWPALAQALAATVICALALALDAALASALPWAAGLLPLAAMVGLPLWHTRNRPGDPLSLGRPTRRAVGWTALLCATTALVFLPAYAGVARHFWGAGPAELARLQRAPLSWQGEPDRALPAAVVVDTSTGLELHNQLPFAVRVGTACSPPAACAAPASAAQVVPRGGRLALGRPIAVRVARADGTPLPMGGLVAGRDATPLESPTQPPRSLGWLGALAVLQLLGVALPEELLFRGWMLPLLQRAASGWRLAAAARRVVPVVLSAGLFALVHLIDQPNLARLLVFFPALLFGWLRQQTASVWACALFHAWCNCLLAVAQTCHGL